MTNTLTYTNLDRVAWVVGREAAEALDREGLIRHDAWSAPKPTHYLVRVTPGPGAASTYNRPRGLRKEFEEVWNYATGVSKYRYYTSARSHAECTYKMQGPAKSQVTRALACGLSAELIPCVLIPVNHVN